MSGRIAVIPARGGSKRIPGKNIIEFCGKPLIAYSLEAARDSDLFDEIHVSTDSDEIAEVAVKLGFPVAFMRLRELADDQTPLVPVLRWVLQEYGRQGKSFNSLCNLMPCAPLIKTEDLTNGYDVFDAGGGDMPVIAVARYPAPIEWAFNMDEDNILAERQPGMFAVRSQDIQPSYFDSGTFVVFPSAKLLDEGYQGGGAMKGFVLPPERAVDIDEPEDLITAETIFWGSQA